MRRPGLTGSFWPTDEQELLLRVALGREAEVEPAWLAARQTLDLDRLEEGSYSLLPLVCRRLVEALPDEPLLPRLKGIYRHTWSKNQILLDDLRRTLELLSGAGAEPVVVGGAARLGYYPELGLRTLSELELLVREHDVEPALRAVGWRGEGVPQRVLAGRSTLDVAAGPRPFALHWRLLPEFPGGSDRLETREREDGGRALATTDELLHTCLGEARTALRANVQWIADAAVIVRTGEVDWSRLVELAEELRAQLRLRDTLRYVAGVVDAELPEAVLARLDRFQPNRRDVLAHKLSGSGGRVLGELPRTLATFVRAGGGALGLPRFLSTTWNVEHSWQLPLVAARKGALTIATRAQRRRSR